MKILYRGLAWIFLFIFFLCRNVAGQDFGYLKAGDLFKYLENEHSGLSLFPPAIDDDTYKLAEQDRSALNRSIKSGIATAARLRKTAESILDNKNYLGFIHLSAALVGTGKECEVLQIYEQLLSDDPRRNYCILYGAFVILDASRNNKEVAVAVSRIVLRCRKEKAPMARTKRYPDLIDTVARESSRARLNR